jgi:hypothetical protein
MFIQLRLNIAVVLTVDSFGAISYNCLDRMDTVQKL